MKVPILRRLRPAMRCAMLMLCAVAPAPAAAELSNDTLIGVGGRSRPAYDGAESQRGEVVPVIRYLGEPWFVRSTQGVLEGGLRLQLAPGLHAGAQLAYEPGRITRESAFLKDHNAPDVDRGASVGAQVEWDRKFGIVPITLLARVRQHTESDRGAQADLRLSVGIFQAGRFGAGLFTQATWANAKSTRSFYGVTPQASAVTRLPAYDAGGGLLYTSAGLLWSFDIARHWAAVGNVEVRQLQGDAKGSPYAERSTNYSVAAGVAYRY